MTIVRATIAQRGFARRAITELHGRDLPDDAVLDGFLSNIRRLVLGDRR